MHGWDYQFNEMLRLIASPVGLVLVIFGAVFAALAVSKPWARLAALTLLVWSTTLSASVVGKEGFNNTLITPLQQIREHTRTVTLVFLAILLLPTLAADKGWRLRLIAAPMALFFAFQLIYLSMETLLGDATRGLLGMGIVVMTLFVIGRGVGSGVRDLRSANAAVKALAGAAVLFALASAVQGIVNPNAIKFNGRFYATTANPQFASTAIGVMMPAVAYLIIQKGVGKFWRLLMSCTLGLLVVFLLWTGSRTGLLMSIIGLAALFRLRLGKGLVAAAAVAVALLVGLQFFGGQLAGADRLLSTEDTRTGAWMSQWNAFQNSPLLGNADDLGLASENSVLWTLARYGIVGFLPLLVAMGAYAWFLVRLQLARGSLDKPHRLLADLVTSVIVVVGVGSVFEGYLLGQFHIAVFSLLTITVVGQYLFDAQQVGLTGGPEGRAYPGLAAGPQPAAYDDPAGGGGARRAGLLTGDSPHPPARVNPLARRRPSGRGGGRPPGRPPAATPPARPRRRP